uniref:Uncharacterized protein n=1 Tax=Amphimedon queenslandica TaxID=400682 RepID=A0A1X7V757_AMPQE
MLEKANEQDLEGLFSFTIRHLESKSAMGSDISQYKLMTVQEGPIDNKQEHLLLLSYFISNWAIRRVSSQTEVSSTEFIV